jgi:phosphatidylglycerophosphate synthase
MLDLILSTIAFFVAAFFLKRYLDEQGIEKGMTRGTLVFVLASAVSFGVSSATDWLEGTVGGKQHVASASQLQGGDVGQLLQSLSPVQGH